MRAPVAELFRGPRLQPTGYADLRIAMSGKVGWAPRGHGKKRHRKTTTGGGKAPKTTAKITPNDYSGKKTTPGGYKKRFQKTTSGCTKILETAP